MRLWGRVDVLNSCIRLDAMLNAEHGEHEPEAERRLMSDKPHAPLAHHVQSESHVHVNIEQGGRLQLYSVAKDELCN